MVDVREIPGIGKTFRRDLACIGITTVEDVRGRNPHDLFARHAAANEAVGHATSKSYLYVLRGLLRRRRTRARSAPVVRVVRRDRRGESALTVLRRARARGSRRRCPGEKEWTKKMLDGGS